MPWVNLRADILAEFAEAQRKAKDDQGTRFYATMAYRADARRTAEREYIANVDFKLRFGPRLAIPRPVVNQVLCERCGVPAEFRQGCPRPIRHKRPDGNPCFG